MPSAATDHPIIAVTGEDDRYPAVRDRARSLARDGGWSVILYDVDAAGLFSSPRPTVFSADGERELYSEAASGWRLDPDALETAGRPAIADQVRALRSSGIEAWAWLPTTRDGAALGAYAERVAASVVLVPSDLEDASILERLAAHHATADPAGRTEIPFEAVDAVTA